MRILVVCQHYYPEPFRLPDICETLVQHGHTVTVVTGTPNYPEGEIYKGYEKGAKADEVLNGVRVHRCPLIPRKTGVLFRILNYYSFVLSSEWYLRRCKEDFDVVFVNQLSPVMMAQAGLSWAKRNGKKCVLYCLDLWPESLLVGGIHKNSAVYKLFLNISRRLYRKADTIVVSSKAFIDYFETTLKITGRDIRWMPQYAEDIFGVISAEEKQKPVVDFLLAGNIGQLQSVETIVEAARLLKGENNIHIHIVGNGVSLENCKTMAEGLENITFHGRHDVSEMPAFYAMADVMMVSLVKDEGLSANLPGKVQSYLAAGKPVVGPINGETPRIIAEAYCGMCSPAEDPEALAQVMRQIAADPERLKIYGENARQYYQNHFSKEIFTTTLTEILRENCVD